MVAAGAGFGRGVRAGGAALAVMGLFRWAEMGPFPPELLALGLFEFLPPEAMERLMLLLGPAPAPALFAVTTMAVLGVAGLAGVVLPRLIPFSRPPVRALCHGGLVTLLALIVFFPALGLDLRGDALPHRLILPAPAGLFLGSLVYGFLLEGIQMSAWFVRSGRQ